MNALAWELDAEIVMVYGVWMEKGGHRVTALIPLWRPYSIDTPRGEPLASLHAVPDLQFSVNVAGEFTSSLPATCRSTYSDTGGKNKYAI